MKTKLFFLIVLFLGISALTYAQTATTAPAEKKDAPAAVSTPDQAKTGECTGHQTMGATTECKFVDANSDGKCDKCGKTEKECKESCKSAPAATETKKEGCSPSCPMHKECGKATGTTEPKK
jgi:hypothetical protein